MKKYYLILLMIMLVFVGCSGMKTKPVDFSVLEQTEQGEGRISEYGLCADPAGLDVVIGNDVSDISMSPVGTTKRMRLMDFPINDATQAELNVLAAQISAKMNEIAGLVSNSSNGIDVTGGGSFGGGVETENYLQADTYVQWGTYTVDTLPTLTVAEVGAIVWISDGTTPFDTTEGDGEYTLAVRWTGTDWEALEIGKIEVAFESLPVSWMSDGTSAPDALDNTTFPPYSYRTFDSAADEDLAFTWFVLPELNVDLTTIRFRVTYLITEATGPSSEGVAFSLAGGWVGDGDSINPTLGTIGTVTDTGLSGSQGTLFVTDWSDVITLSGTAPGKIAEFNFFRDTDDADDDYGQLVGVVKVDLLLSVFPYVVELTESGGGAPE